MTEPAVPATVPTASSAVPAGVRVASIISWVVGIVTTLAALATGIPALTDQGSAAPLAFMLCSGVLACAAGYLIWKQKRLGVLLLVLALAVPVAVNLLNHQPAQGNIFVTVALALAALNWKHLQ